MVRCGRHGNFGSGPETNHGKVSTTSFHTLENSQRYRVEGLVGYWLLWGKESGLGIKKGHVNNILGVEQPKGSGKKSE
jgi:hypothetical protein